MSGALLLLCNNGSFKAKKIFVLNLNLKLFEYLVRLAASSESN